MPGNAVQCSAVQCSAKCVVQKSAAVQNIELQRIELQNFQKCKTFWNLALWGKEKETDKATKRRKFRKAACTVLELHVHKESQ